MADGKGDYGTIHVMEDEMRAAGQGVFEARSGESSKRAAKADAAPKAEAPAPKKASRAKK